MPKKLNIWGKFSLSLRPTLKNKPDSWQFLVSFLFVAIRFFSFASLLNNIHIEGYKIRDKQIHYISHLLNTISYSAIESLKKLYLQRVYRWSGIAEQLSCYSFDQIVLKFSGIGSGKKRNKTKQSKTGKKMCRV